MNCQNEMTIFRGTTPTLYFKFDTVHPADFESAFLVIKQHEGTIIEKDIQSAKIAEDTISWILTQEETLLLECDKRSQIFCDWKTNSGLRGTSEPAFAKISDSGKDEVI